MTKMKSTAISFWIFADMTKVDAINSVDRALRMEFVQKMDEVRRQTHQVSDINRKLFTAATPMFAPEFMKPRILDEPAQDYGDNSTTDDAATNYANGDDAATDDGTQTASNAAFAIDLENYALKYTGCSNIHTYSTELAEDNADSVLAMNRFVTLRLCPKSDCSKYYGFGCTSGYGDYLITMREYLEIMSETYFKQYAEYCQTCEACLNPNSSKTNSSNGYYGWNEYAADSDSGGNCRYSKVCSNYKAVCKEYNQQVYQLEEYFECSPVSFGATNVYLGPHCDSDGKTLGIGLYSDKYCNEYIKDLKEISRYLGMDIDDGYMKPFHTDNCISCVASEGYSLDSKQDKNDINSVCNDIYGAAAKCNKYLGLDQDIFVRNKKCRFL